MGNHVVDRIKKEGYRCYRIFKGIYLVRTGSAKTPSYTLIFTKK